ncbi:MarR family winged helix-turn-helix transcriptional regulator [Dysgonomonas sp. 520]|uniref:MarR family winged helix-turn-helix transcriptional regulator n=1 Tax=Dysgonomonas sp. 520 TaxID=2302931 RepID=UPI0013D3C33B|nr:MarR family transcriptional regulator [Dysgonomonas sp. 520]NDW09848.1 MarR family transcriptional regulator [Dysgonomonas sp. 520]
MRKICNHESTENEIGYLIWQITKVWQRGRQKILDEFGLTSSQIEILGAIYHLSEKKEEEITQIFLSQETNIDPMTTSTILRNLEKKRLIIRKKSEMDTRARSIELTKEGYKLFEKAIEKVKSGQELVYQNIDKEALRTQLRILLDTINKLKNF